jgi:hypothetical protein
MTRSFIQKAVCIIARRAYFGAIKQLLEPAVRVYFAQGPCYFSPKAFCALTDGLNISNICTGAFGDRIILEKCYALLKAHFAVAPSLSDISPFAGTRAGDASAPSSTSTSPIRPGPSYDSHTMLSEEEEDSWEDDFGIGTPPPSPPSRKREQSNKLDDVPLSPASPVRILGDRAPKLTNNDVLNGVRLRWFIRTFGRNALTIYKLLFLSVIFDTIMHLSSIHTH